MAEISGSILAVYADEDAILNSSDIDSDNDDVWIANENTMPPLESRVRIRFLLPNSKILLSLIIMRYLNALLPVIVLSGSAFSSCLFGEDGINQSIKLEIKRSIQKGLNWLVQEQNASRVVNGGSGYPALTGLALRL